MLQCVIINTGFGIKKSLQDRINDWLRANAQITVKFIAFEAMAAIIFYEEPE